MRFHTQTAGVSLTPQQPLNNLTRVALQALAGVLGGTQSLHTDAYDEALAVPTAEAALLALRQQQVIAEESGVDATVDPLGGSWFVEALTDETERQVWRYIDEIDRRGGMVAAVNEGYPQREIADAAYRYQREFDAGERRVVGVNAYVDETEETRVPVLAVPPGSLERHLARLERTRRERDAAAVEAALRGLREAASRPGHERDQPHAALHPLRRGVRHARRAVRGPARRLRGVPRAGRGLRSATGAGRSAWRDHRTRPAAAPSTMTSPAAWARPNIATTSPISPPSSSIAWAPATDRSGRVGTSGCMARRSRRSQSCQRPRPILTSAKNSPIASARPSTGGPRLASPSARPSSPRTSSTAPITVPTATTGPDTISCPGMRSQTATRASPASVSRRSPLACSTIRPTVVTMRGERAQPAPRGERRDPFAAPKDPPRPVGSIPVEARRRSVASRGIEVADERDEEALRVRPIGAVVGQHVHLVGDRPGLDHDRAFGRLERRLGRQGHGRLDEPTADRAIAGRHRGELRCGQGGGHRVRCPIDLARRQRTSRRRIVRRPEVDPAQARPDRREIADQAMTGRDLVDLAILGQPPREAEALAERDELVDRQMRVGRDRAASRS